MDSGVCAVTVDLVRLEFIDSTGLSVLVTTLKRMREDGGDLALRSLSPSTLKVFDHGECGARRAADVLPT